MTPDAVSLARGLLADLDGEVRSVDAKIISGAPTDFIGYRELLARRNGVLAARRLVVERLSQEQRRFLGLSD